MKRPAADARRLRVAIANVEPERLDELAGLVAGLGHEPIDWASVADPTVEPDAALVGRTGPDEATLALVASIAHEHGCPVVVALPDHDVEFVQAATRAGAFGYLVGLSREDLECMLAVVVERHREYRGLQDAFARRAVVEQAKGILMAVHGVDQDAAFDLLRAHARSNSRRLVDVAETVVEGHPLLVPSWARPSSPLEL